MSIGTAQIKPVFSPGALQYLPHAVKIDCISCRNDGQATVFLVSKSIQKIIQH